MALSNVQNRTIDKNDFGATLTYSFASTPTDGNLIILFASNNASTSAMTTPSGFLKVIGEDGATDTPGTNIYYKWASSESNSYGVTDSGPGWNGNCIGVEVSGGVGSGDPADVAAVENLVGYSAPVTASVTTATDHAFVFGFTTQFNNDPAGLSTPSGWTRLAFSGNTRGGVLFFIDKSPAGSTGGDTLTGSNGFPNNNYAYAIKPGGGAAEIAGPGSAMFRYSFGRRRML